MQKIYCLILLVIAMEAVQCHSKKSTNDRSENNYIHFDIDSLQIEGLAEVDSSFLKQYILKINGLTGWQQAESDYGIIHGKNLDSIKAAYIKDMLRETHFYKVSFSICNGYRHELILKTYEKEPYSESYSGLYLLILITKPTHYII